MSFRKTSFFSGHVGSAAARYIELISDIMNHSKSIVATLQDGSDKAIHISQIPDTCPFCHHAIDPILGYAYCNTNRWREGDCLQAIYRCPKKDCDKIFIAYYKSPSSNCSVFEITRVRPVDRAGRKFTETIQEISPIFCTIYNQALSAEEDSLSEISGAGYRKALEFLVKDYLIKKHPERKEEILKKFLGNCIDEDITNDNIKSMAKRATWLGNDETHYLRKWGGKDVKDLKSLIDVTLYWIEMEKVTEDTMVEMPEN